MEQQAGLGGWGKISALQVWLYPRHPWGRSHTLRMYEDTAVTASGLQPCSPCPPLPLPAGSPAPLAWQASHQHSHVTDTSFCLPDTRCHLPAHDGEVLGVMLPSDPPLPHGGESTSSLGHKPEEPPSPAVCPIAALAGRLRQHSSRSVGTARRLRHRGSEKTRGVPPISSKCKGLFRVPATTSSSSRTTQSENQFFRRK